MLVLLAFFSLKILGGIPTAGIKGLYHHAQLVITLVFSYKGHNLYDHFPDLCGVKYTDFGT